MHVESKALTLAASVLFVALTQSEAGKELIISGHISINNSDFKLAEGMVLDRPVFVPPSLDQVQKYVEHMGYLLKTERFYAYQSMRDWKLSSGQQITDWRAAIDSWQSWEKITPDRIKTAEEVWKTG